MNNQHNPEQDDQELSQEQLKDAAGGAAFIKFDGLKKDAADGIHMTIPDFRANRPTNALDKSSPKLDVSSGGEDKFTPEPFS